MRELQNLADRLWQAERDAAPMPTIRDSHVGLSLDQAYQVQWLNVERELKGGAQLVGYKVGLTSEAAQKFLGISHPDLGHLYQHFEVKSGGELKLEGLIQPLVEPEVAFLLNRDLVGPNVSYHQALAAIECATASLEIVDSRIESWKIRAVDSIADNASSARFVLGEHRVKMADVALETVPAQLKQNGTVKLRGVARAVMGHPVHAIVYLANELGRLGKSLRAGQWVLSGSITEMIPFRLGDEIDCEMGPLGPVGFKVS